MCKDIWQSRVFSSRLLKAFKMRPLRLVFSIWIVALASGQTVSIQPGSVSLSSNQSLQFALQVTQGGVAPSATWSIDPPSAGNISATGFYQAPSTISVQTTVTIKAITAATPPKEYQATVTLRPIQVRVTPASLTLTSLETRPFAASLTPANVAQSVTWTLEPSIGSGSISVAGDYTAPAVIGTTRTVQMVARSIADPTKTDSSTITLDPIRLSIAPLRPNLTVGQTQAFSITSPNGGSTQVTTASIRISVPSAQMGLTRLPFRLLAKLKSASPRGARSIRAVSRSPLSCYSPLI